LSGHSCFLVRGNAKDAGKGVSSLEHAGWTQGLCLGQKQACTGRRVTTHRGKTKKTAKKKSAKDS